MVIPGPGLRGAVAAARAVVCRKTSSRCEVRTETNALSLSQLRFQTLLVNFLPCICDSHCSEQFRSDNDDKTARRVGVILFPTALRIHHFTHSRDALVDSPRPE